MNCKRDGPMNESRCFFEYERITDERLAAAIRKEKSLQSYFSASFDGIRAGQYCGIVNVEGEDFYILPKIAEDAEHDFDVFIHMLMYAYDVDISNEDLSGSTNRKHRLMEVLIGIFTGRLLQQLRLGLYREYMIMRDNLTTLRGKYLIDENIRHNITPQRIYCEFDEFSMDNPLNRFFLFAVKTLMPFAPDRRELRMIEAILDETAYERIDIARNYRIDYNRLNARYRESVEIGMLLLRHLIPLFSSGKRSFAFLFDMNVLFERFIGRIVREIEPDTQLQTERNFGNLKLKPDIVTPQMIIDTKYKRVRGKEDVSAADKYQMFAYGRNFGIRKTMLLYPKHLKDVSEDLVLGKGDEGVEMKIRSVNLGIYNQEDFIEGLKIQMKDVIHEFK